MGLQSLIFYTLVTWLPDLLSNYNYSNDEAGWMLFLLQISIFPTTIVIPMMAEKLKNQSALSVFGSILFVLGTLGFMVGSGFVLVLSSISIGLASGTTLSLCMMFFSLRTKDGRQAAEVSGMAQSVGYLLAALGPWLFGLLFDVSGDMFFSLTMLLICSIIMIFVGFFSGLNRFVSV